MILKILIILRCHFEIVIKLSIIKNGELILIVVMRLPAISSKITSAWPPIEFAGIYFKIVRIDTIISFITITSKIKFTDSLRKYDEMSRGLVLK